MEQLIITVNFPDLNVRDVKAAYDGIEIIRKSVEKSLSKHPLGEFSGKIEWDVW